MPHCCHYIGAFQDSKQIYIVMEHAAGGDLLEQLLKEGRAMTEKRVVREVRLGGGWLGRDWGGVDGDWFGRSLAEASCAVWSSSG